MTRILYIIWQLSFGLIQSIAGLFVYLINIKARHTSYRGSIVTEWKLNSGLSLGLFIFIPRCDEVSGPDYDEHIDTLTHEYGHTIQSLILGPLYLIIIGLPSLLWCALPYFETYRRAKGVSYYDFYPERWANYLGRR